MELKDIAKRSAGNFLISFCRLRIHIVDTGAASTGSPRSCGSRRPRVAGAGRSIVSSSTLQCDRRHMAAVLLAAVAIASLGGFCAAVDHDDADVRCRLRYTRRAHRLRHRDRAFRRRWSILLRALGLQRRDRRRLCRRAQMVVADEFTMDGRTRWMAAGHHRARLPLRLALG